MLRFLGYLIIFIIGGAIGFFVGGTGGGAAGTLVGACKVVNASVAAGTMTQDQANATVKSVFSEIATETKVPEDQLKQQLPKILEQMKKAHGDTATACQAAIAALQ